MQDTFSKKLYDLRLAKGITQEELAERVGVTRQAISKWERGEGLPDVYNLSSLAKALGVSVDELVGASDGNPHVHVDLSHGSSDYEKSTNYLKKLLMKAKTTTNSEEAKKIRKTLLTLGGIGLALGITLLLTGFIGFASGGFEAVQHFEMFNPIPFMIMFLVGGIITGISSYAIYGGLSIVVAGVTTKFLDTSNKCPKCGDTIDPDEKICSHCGYDLKAETSKVCPVCGKENKPNDIYCRECGRKLG